MKHFEINQWADMVRGLVTAGEQEDMSAHLTSGCRSCRRVVSILRAVARVAVMDTRDKVPSYAVHSARAIFALQRPEKLYFFPRIVGQLVYDSFKEPLPVGLRARHRMTRHMMYQAGDHSVDIRIEHLRAGGSVTLAGQIISRANPERPIALLPVLLLSGKKILAHAVSNGFGEFQLEYRPTRRLRLYLQGAQDLQRQIELPLDCAAGDKTSPETQPRKTKKKKT
jgi:hypothetical protein